MKWEDKIKETLEKRDIKPSDASWNVLADRLDAAETHKSKAVFWWMGIAASLIAILFTVSLFFNDSTSEIQKSVVVDTQEQVDDSSMPEQDLPQQKQLVELPKNDASLHVDEKNTDKKETLKKPNSFTPPIKQNLSVAENEKPLKPLEIVTQNQTLEDKKVSEIIAQIHSLKDKGQTVTDADIDALLHQAQKEIAYQTILNENTGTVDAHALLQDVESDLQKSFRNKILEALKDSYETLKTSVAERNN